MFGEAGSSKKSFFSLQIGLCGAAISCWLLETRQSARLSFSLTPWRWSRGIWPWVNLRNRQKNTGQSREPAAVLGGRTVAGFARCARQAEKEDRGTRKWQKLLQFIHSGFSFGQHGSSSLKEAALKTAVTSFHQEKVNRKTNRPVAGMTATLQRGLAQLTIPAALLSWFLCGCCMHTCTHLHPHRYCNSPSKPHTGLRGKEQTSI